MHPSPARRLGLSEESVEAKEAGAGSGWDEGGGDKGGGGERGAAGGVE